MGNKQGLQNQQSDSCCYKEQYPGIPVASTPYSIKIQRKEQQSLLVQNDLDQQLISLEPLDSPHIISDLDRYISSGYGTLFDQPQTKQHDKPDKGLTGTEEYGGVQVDFSYNEACHAPVTPYDIIPPSYCNEVQVEMQQDQSGFSPNSKIKKQISPRKYLDLQLLSMDSLDNLRTTNDADRHISAGFYNLFNPEHTSSTTHSPMQKKLLSTDEYNFSFSGVVSEKCKKDKNV